MKKLIFLLLGGIFFLGACSATKVTRVWQDENYSGKFKNILVVNLFLDEEIGRASELLMVRQLRQQGVAAEAGHTVLPTGSRSSVEAITQAIGKHAFDGILLSKIVDRVEETRVTGAGACNSRWESDYRREQRYSLSPCQPSAQTSTTAVYGLITSLYSTQGGALVISLSSETSVDRPTEKLISGFAKTVVGRLSAANLFAGRE
ncbi:MAG: hypothetical protein JXR80_07700 [Deltaproteobacteria bacterium]|nr:hypothetical protein [Deltaproteobacteria bacterium]